MSRENQDPYRLDYHAEGCSEDSIWNDEGDNLLSVYEVSERGCNACLAQWEMWSQILENTGTPAFDADGNQVGAELGDPMWGDLAFRGFAVLEMVKEFNYPVTQLTARDYVLMQTVAAEARRRELQRMLQDRARTSSK